MKIKVPGDREIETDDLSDEQLLQSHAYYYQLGLRDVARAFHDALENSRAPKQQKPAPVVARREKGDIEGQ